jgi:dTMP kinase
MEREKGKFVVFEGAGGSGKGTQINFAKDLLTNNGLQVVYTREPGGIEPAEEIRRLIFTLREKKLIGPEGQLSLFFAARDLWVIGVVVPNIDGGTNVLTDRCHTSTGAYQGYAEGGDQKQILAIADVVLGNYKPDAVVLLDVSRETSMQRRGKDVNGDPFDKETPAYFDRLIAGYREMAKTGWGGLNWFVVNGEPKPEIVSESVAKVLEVIFEKKLQR